MGVSKKKAVPFCVILIAALLATSIISSSANEYWLYAKTTYLSGSKFVTEAYTLSFDELCAVEDDTGYVYACVDDEICTDDTSNSVCDAFDAGSVAGAMFYLADVSNFVGVICVAFALFWKKHKKEKKIFRIAFFPCAGLALLFLIIGTAVECSALDDVADEYFVNYDWVYYTTGFGLAIPAIVIVCFEIFFFLIYNLVMISKKKVKKAAKKSKQEMAATTTVAAAPAPAVVAAPAPAPGVVYAAQPAPGAYPAATAGAGPDPYMGGAPAYPGQAGVAYPGQEAAIYQQPAPAPVM